MDERMIKRFTAPRRVCMLSRVRWYAWKLWRTMWKSAESSARWFAEDAGEIFGEFLAAGGMLAVMLLLPIMAALICG